MKSALIPLICCIILFSSTVPSAHAQSSDQPQPEFPSRPWLIAVQFSGSYGLHINEDQFYQETGTGYTLDIIIPLSRSFAIQGSFDRSGLHAPDDLTYWDTTYTTFKSTVTYRATRYSLALRYTKDMKWPFTVPRLKYYFDAGGGSVSQEMGGTFFLRRSGAT